MKLTGSPKLNFLLGEMGIFNYRQVLEHLPRRYESYAYSRKEQLLHLEDGQRIVLFGRLLESAKVMRFRSVSKTSFLFESETGEEYQVVAWNRPFLGKTLNLEDNFTLVATYDKKNHGLNLVNVRKGRIAPEESIKPVYSLPRDYPSHSFIQLVEKALKEENGKIYDKIPSYFMKKYRLLHREEAIRLVHKPSTFEDVRQGLRTLKYEEALAFSLRNRMVREENKALAKGRILPVNREKISAFSASLPYKMTSDQQKAVLEAIGDMDSASLMYRLLQGDVGTGKTLVAGTLMYANYTRGEQSALMAPTDSLARQHYEYLKNLFSAYRLNITLLVGNMSTEERSLALSDIADGTSDFIVGTHALFSKGVEYANLGLAIIDEQHKFGVNQRNTLSNKGEHADLLMMSATPIPRTLSMTVYGDMDVSVLSEFPNKKRDLSSVVLSPKDKKIKSMINESIETGHRVYVVCPKIEGGEDEKTSSSVLDVYEVYKERYPGKVVLLHGKMSQEDKEAALLSFRLGICPIIVSTSVIEVGIDVKPANLMIVYDPTSFSLSGLHQLRGRIGRDGSKATFIMAYAGNDEDELSKLNVLVGTEDGFEIAEEDLKRRGPGEITGTKQSGMPDFRFVNIIDDFRMMESARNDASFIMENRDQSGFSWFCAKIEESLKDE